MRDAPRIRDRLRTAALVLRPRNAILRPDLHRHPDDVIALLAEQIARDAGVDPAAHAEQDALFRAVHGTRKVGAKGGMVNGRGGALGEHGLPARPRLAGSQTRLRAAQPATRPGITTEPRVGQTQSASED